MKNLINNVNRKLGRKSRKGFSLVELLVVIAVIGVIAAIAIPAMSNVFENSRGAKAKRNAQNIASTFAAARAAGWNPAVADTVTSAVAVTDAATAAQALNTGVMGAGQFKTTKFQVVLSTNEQTAAAADPDGTGTQTALLTYDADAKVLTYNGTSGDL